MKINSKDVSVVVQGAIDKQNTPKCLASIRKYLPEAEIILSTWEGSDVSGLIYDKLILNKDPGATLFDPKLLKNNNLNRIIISSQKGVQKASRKYILRMRSDMRMKNAHVLSFQDNYPRRNKEDTLFKNRIFAYSFFSIKYEEYLDKTYYSPFHISDWCVFGLAEDIKQLYNVATVQEPDFSQYFMLHKEEQNMWIDIWPERLWKMSPEQYIISENAKKIYPDLQFPHRLAYQQSNAIDISDKFIVNNFIIKSVKEWGIKNFKKEYKNKSLKDMSKIKNGIWLGKHFELDYKKYCDPEYIIPLRYTWQEDLHLSKYIGKLKKHWKRFMVPFKILNDGIAGFAEVVYYALHILCNFLYYGVKLLFNLLGHKQ